MTVGWLGGCGVGAWDTRRGEESALGAQRRSIHWGSFKSMIDGDRAIVCESVLGPNVP